MDLLMCIGQALFVTIFLLTGSVTLAQPHHELATGRGRWATGLSDSQLRTIGALQVLAALALFLGHAL